MLFNLVTDESGKALREKLGTLAIAEFDNLPASAVEALANIALNTPVAQKEFIIELAQVVSALKEKVARLEERLNAI